MLSMYFDEGLVREALRKGATGYLLKRSVSEELLLAVRAAKRGEIYLSPPVARALVGEFLKLRDDSGSDTAGDKLSSREHEVLQLVIEGNSNSYI